MGPLRDRKTVYYMMIASLVMEKNLHTIVRFIRKLNCPFHLQITTSGLAAHSQDTRNRKVSQCPIPPNTKPLISFVFLCSVNMCIYNYILAFAAYFHFTIWFHTFLRYVGFFITITYRNSFSMASWASSKWLLSCVVSSFDEIEYHAKIVLIGLNLIIGGGWSSLFGARGRPQVEQTKSPGQRETIHNQFSMVLAKLGVQEGLDSPWSLRNKLLRRRWIFPLSGERAASLESRSESERKSSGQRRGRHVVEIRWCAMALLMDFSCSQSTLPKDGNPETPCRDQSSNLLHGAPTQRCPSVQAYNRSTSPNHVDIPFTSLWHSVCELMRVNLQIYYESTYMLVIQHVLVLRLAIPN